MGLKMNSGHIIFRNLNKEDADKCPDKVYGRNDVTELKKDLVDLRNISEIKFLTGNPNKVKELTKNLQLDNVNLSCEDIDLPEIQSHDEFAILQDKCQRAYRAIKNSSNGHQLVTLVEDTSLDFSALGGMPGPYVKWFLKAMGPTKLSRMLAGFEDKSAKAICTYALMLNERSIVFFRGIACGRIVEPRGTIGWGWDPIFEELESGMTFGEMQASEKSKFSHRATAIDLLRNFLAPE